MSEEGGFPLNIKFFLWFCLGALVFFILSGIFKGNFEWDNLTPILVGGFVGTAVASLEARRSK
jgi:hypothetical protein